MKFMEKMRVGTRLLSAFAIVSAITGVVAYVGVLNMAKMDSLSNEMYSKELMGLSHVKEANLDLLNVEREVKNVLLTSSPEERSRLKDEMGKYAAAMEQELKHARPDITSEKGRDVLAQFDKAWPEYQKTANELVAMALSNKGHADGKLVALATGPLRVKADLVDQLLSELAHINEHNAQALATSTSVIYGSSRTFMIWLGVLAVLGAIALGLFITMGLLAQLGGEPAFVSEVAKRVSEGDLSMKLTTKAKDQRSVLFAMKAMVERLSAIVAEVRAGADGLSTAAEQVSATSQALSQASSEQAASVEETSASIEQMTASISQNTENAKVTDGMASKAATEASEGGEAVKQTVEAMNRIAEKIGIIDDIAYQTNLLALNAAIEAARAGEHGKGFAVVAAEVRKLAERSQVAAQEIGEVASSSVALAEKAGRLLDEMVPSIRKTSDLVQEISAASEEQSSGVGQINTAVGQLNQVTQQNASSSEELAATAEEMSSQAEQLQQTVSFFRLNGVTAPAPKVAADGAEIRRATVARSGSAPMPLRAVAAGAYDEREFTEF